MVGWFRKIFVKGSAFVEKLTINKHSINAVNNGNDYVATLPDKSGTIAFTDDIPPGGGSETLTSLSLNSQNELEYEDENGSATVIPLPDLSPVLSKKITITNPYMRDGAMSLTLHTASDSNKSYIPTLAVVYVAKDVQGSSFPSDYVECTIHPSGYKSVADYSSDFLDNDITLNSVSNFTSYRIADNVQDVKGKNIMLTFNDIDGPSTGTYYGSVQVYLEYREVSFI